MLIDIKTDNDDTYVTDSALHFPPPCNPSRPICTRMWWCRHRACISYIKFSIGFYSVKNKKIKCCDVSNFIHQKKLHWTSE